MFSFFQQILQILDIQILSIKREIVLIITVRSIKIVNGTWICRISCTILFQILFVTFQNLKVLSWVHEMVRGRVFDVDDGLKLVGSYLHDLIVRPSLLNRKFLKVETGVSIVSP